jgi:hypothetical protein
MGVNKSKNITNTETYTCDLCTFEIKYHLSNTKYHLSDMHYIKVAIAGIDIYYWNDPFNGKSKNHMLQLAIENYFKINKEATKQDFTILVLTTIRTIQKDKNLKNSEYIFINIILLQLVLLNK